MKAPSLSIAKAINIDAEHLCQACLTGDYPTEAGQTLYQLSLNSGADCANGIDIQNPKRLVEGAAEPALPPTRL